MPDFLLELLSEEIPARMQGKAQQDLARLFSEQISAAGLAAAKIESYATPRRLVLIARGLPTETAAVREETKGPRASAPPQALEGFLRKTGLARDQLEERGGILFAVVDKPGRATSAVLAEAIPAIVRAFPWPKSMRWGEASGSTESPRWIRPLQGIVALLGEQIVEFEIAGIRSGAATVGHRFHHPGVITLGGAHDYLEKLKACHVVVDPAERARIIAEGARAAAEAAGLTLVEDEGLLAENAGLTEWPVPLLGRFDPAFLEVPREVIQLTMRTNQKYFACVDGEGRLAPSFVCTANIEAADGGAAIVQGNERVLSARLSDAKFFWEVDQFVFKDSSHREVERRRDLEEFLSDLWAVRFHEKLGTVAAKTKRVAKLAQWLIEQKIVSVGTVTEQLDRAWEHGADPDSVANEIASHQNLNTLAYRAGLLSKADLVTQMVGEFPELQGIIGGHLARIQGEDSRIAEAIRDHYKPVGPDDEVPTTPVTIAVSLADKLDTVFAFLAINEPPTGSRDPFALRRQILGAISIVLTNQIRLPLTKFAEALGVIFQEQYAENRAEDIPGLDALLERYVAEQVPKDAAAFTRLEKMVEDAKEAFLASVPESSNEPDDAFVRGNQERRLGAMYRAYAGWNLWFGEWCEVQAVVPALLSFATDRLKVQQREAGVRHDLIDAVFALGGEDDLVRLLARVKALQAFVETREGTDLLAGYKRAANILRKENYPVIPAKAGTSGREGTAGLPEAPASAGGTELNKNKTLSYTPEKEEAALIAALDSAEPRARAAVEAENFEGAMAALASLRGPVDAFFDKVTVNDPDPAKREARLALLARMRDAVHRVADFSRIEG